MTSKAETNLEGAKFSINEEFRAVSWVSFPSYQSSYIPGKLVRRFRDVERKKRKTQRRKQVSTEKQPKQSQRWKADGGQGRLQQRLEREETTQSGAEGQKGKRERRENFSSVCS